MEDKEEYTNSLENLLIFMCQTYEDEEKALFALAKQGNNALFEVPRIQGTRNTIPISQIAKLKFDTPKYGFKEIKQIILKKREGGAE